MSYKNNIKQNFACASSYDSLAYPQQKSALWLAQVVNELSLPSTAPQILEIGCGTGFLTEAIQNPQMQKAEWLISDLAPAMVVRTKTKLGQASVVSCLKTPANPKVGSSHLFFVMDGERLCFPLDFHFDAIVSNLCFQWFTDPLLSIGQMLTHLKPGGYLAFTTMGEASFNEWRQAHSELGLRAGTPDYPSLQGLIDCIQAAHSGMNYQLQADEHFMPVSFASALDFMLHVRGIGAQQPDPAGDGPINAGALRRVMKRFDANGGVATYHILRCIIQRPAD